MTDLPTVKTTPAAPTPERVIRNRRKYGPRTSNFPAIATERPPRDTLRPQTAAQGLAEFGRSNRKRWATWTARQRITVLAGLLQLIWPIYLYAMATQAPGTLASQSTIVIMTATAMYVPAMIGLVAAWLFFGERR